MIFKSVLTEKSLSCCKCCGMSKYFIVNMHLYAPTLIG